MLWLILSIATAILYTVIGTLNKKVLKDCDASYLALAMSIITAIIHVPLIFILLKYVTLTKNFFLILILVGFTAGFAQFLYMHSLKRGKLSKTLPLVALSPIFTIPFAYLIINELPNILGIIGIFLIVIGAYILNLEKVSKNILAPFKQIYTNPASRFMLGVAVIYGFGIIIDKIAINNSNPLTYFIFSIYPILIVQTAFLAIKDKNNLIKRLNSVIKTKLRWIIIISIIASIMILFQVYAISLTFAAYVSAIKRTSAIFAVMAGYLFFKEKKHFWTTLIGAVLMVIGTIFLTL